MKRIVVFASGSGSNAENIIRYFNKSTTATVTQVLCNNERAKIFDRCKNLGISCLLFNRADFTATDSILNLLKEKADFIVLAGFLWKIPSKIVASFPNKIINIHPALLPKYGGKGMYGAHVHKAVKKNKEKESGITIHFVNEKYDDGAIILQAKTPISPEDSAEEIATKVLKIEHAYFPITIEQVILGHHG